MSPPVLLDLFCGAGGAAMGYHRSGFDVVGIDVNPQPHFPFEFHQMDWRDALRQFRSWADVIHASPPCQAFSAMNNVHHRDHPRLIEPVRAALQATGKPWVIENVEGARAAMCQPVTLCGTMFGLGVIRHRLFESSLPIRAPRHPGHTGTFYSPSGHGDPNWRHRDANPHLRGKGYTQRCREAMGIDWMNRDELAQAIPPTYTEFIGRQLMSFLERREGGDHKP